MSTHEPEFESLESPSFLHQYVLAKLDTSSIRVKPEPRGMDCLSQSSLACDQ